jgi:hypothetical protein
MCTIGLATRVLWCRRAFESLAVTLAIAAVIAVPGVGRAKGWMEQSQGATVRGVSTETEHGKTLYEVETTLKGHTRNILIAADGSVAEVEEEIAVASLPAPVKVTLEQEAGQGRILKVESVTKGGKLVFYEARVQKAGKKTDVTVGSDGTLIPEGKQQ